jgi:uncharacterized protein YjgD (DUF1641 family)
MASNVVIVDSEFITIARELSEGTDEIKDIIKKYKAIIEHLSQKGIVDIAINSVLVTKVEKVNIVIEKLEPVINNIYSESVRFIDNVEEKDRLV